MASNQEELPKQQTIFDSAVDSNLIATLDAVADQTFTFTKEEGLATHLSSLPEIVVVKVLETLEMEKITVKVFVVGDRTYATYRGIWPWFDLCGGLHEPDASLVAELEKRQPQPTTIWNEMWHRGLAVQTLYLVFIGCFIALLGGTAFFVYLFNTTSEIGTQTAFILSALLGGMALFVSYFVFWLPWKLFVRGAVEEQNEKRDAFERWWKSLHPQLAS